MRAQVVSQKSNPCTGTTPTYAATVRLDGSTPRATRNSSPNKTDLRLAYATVSPTRDATSDDRQDPFRSSRFACFTSSFRFNTSARARDTHRLTTVPKNAPPMPTPHRHALLLAALLLLAASAAAQPDERDPWYRRNGDDDDDGGGVGMPSARKQTSFSAPMVVLLVALIATFFFIGFFSIYIRQCGRGGGSPSRSVPAAALLAMSRQEQQQQPNRQLRGLDPDVLASFPTMTYAEARALREHGGGDAALECAVCLSEFGDEERLRLLPECSHAFHPDCIGEWLAGHVTCPVCRRSLVPPEEKPAADTAPEANGSENEELRRPEVAIAVNRDGEDEEERRELERIGSLRRAVRSRSRSGRPFSRAHSTGHSLSARFDGDLERFTLRLPDQVRREMMAAAGEESMRRTVGRSARIGRSDRWPSFIARTFSSRVPFWAAFSSRAPADVETAGSTTTTPATIHEKTTVDASASSAKGSLRFDCLGGGVTGARVSSAAGDSEDEAEEEKAIVRRV